MFSKYQRDVMAVYRKAMEVRHETTIVDITGFSIEIAEKRTTERISIHGCARMGRLLSLLGSAQCSGSSLHEDIVHAYTDEPA